jgi:hypothetical protein
LLRIHSLREVVFGALTGTILTAGIYTLFQAVG